MNQIMIPLKVHAVKLEYRRLLLEKMPHGCFRLRRGKRTVVINYDPDDPKISSKTPKFFSAATKRGKEYAVVITKYLKVKAEYDNLLDLWNSTYCFAPPRVRFPVVNQHSFHEMNNEYFDEQKENLGKYESDTPTYSDHGAMKSKNELMSAELLDHMGIPFKYETELYIGEANKKLNPDFLLSFYEIDRCFYLEVLGMNDKGDYSVKTATKIYDYSKGIYRPGREVIYVILYDKSNFDSDYFVQQVMTAFDSMIPDSALDWGCEDCCTVKTA